MATLSLLVLTASPVAAQATEILTASHDPKDTLWFHSDLPKKSAGSAQLGRLDTGEPPMGLGLQAVWLEWTENNLFLARLGGGFATDEVTTPPGGVPPLGMPITNLLGAATLNGGFIETFTGPPTPTLTSVRPCLGSFLWTLDKLYLLALGGGLLTAEVTAPGGASIADVQGVTVIASQIFDANPPSFPHVVAAHIIASALVYTPTAVWHVDVDLSGGIAFATVAVNKPAGLGGGPITKTRGTAVMIGGFFPMFPPPVVGGAAFIWNDANVFLFQQSPALSISEVLKPDMTSISACWGVMVIAGTAINPPRGAVLIWQQDHAFLATVLPALTVVEAPQPPATGGGPIVSGVAIQTDPVTLLPVERQASYLYEILADYFGDVLPGELPRGGRIIGQNQRTP